LDASEYDDLISKEFQLQYQQDTKTLLIDYVLPSPDDLPTTKSVQFVASTGEMKKTQVAAKDKKALFEDICYQVSLRTIHEIFEADTPEHIQRVLFNGLTNYIDKATGQEVHATILSLMVSREEFCAINLARIEPKACFKSLKGVSAASLIGLSPIAPIMELAKDDKRFVDAQSVNMDTAGSTNLASMDWEDFEHLVRELFDKEFASRGGEVKVTQSSSDGGVDAIAFDPDPISGGKIIIQAKRYTKTVGVSAVRDLYGTTMNEGANKGILVTTADYGPDAYKFASDKPLTLITGANLLHLLAKHGIRAKIDLREARKELGLREG
jgi:restriction system protein